MASPYPSVLISDSTGREIPVPPFINQASMNQLTDEFVTQPEDIFVVTYPRSGTTWTEQIVHLLLNNGEQGNQRLTDDAPWLETLPNRPGGVTAFLQTVSDWRLFTCHLPISFMPDFSATKGRYLYVARNPKDVAVSYYHHDRSKGGYEGTWNEHFERFMQGKLHFGFYFDHVIPWWQASQNAENILFIKYEDMQQDFKSVLQKIARFLNIPLDDALTSRVTSGSRFQAMAAQPQTNFDWIPQRDGVPKHYRKGQVGDWRNQFTPEQSQHLDAIYREKLTGTALRFDFGRGVILP